MPEANIGAECGSLVGELRNTEIVLLVPKHERPWRSSPVNKLRCSDPNERASATMKLMLTARLELAHQRAEIALLGIVEAGIKRLAGIDDFSQVCRGFLNMIGH